MRLRDLSEAELLARVFPVYAAATPPAWGSVPVGPGDDAAVVGAPSGTVVATTDSMVRGRDWRDEWSSAHDVGVKMATQNLADVAAMGAAPTGLLVSLVADPELDVDWAVGLSRGIASVAAAASAPVVGGDLSSGPPGVVVVSVTALGDLRGRPPVLRSGARVGDVVAACGSLGLSGGGLALYLAGEVDPDGAGWTGVLDDRSLAVRALMRHHRAPVAPWWVGPEAAEAGAHALVDVSDGLVTDVGRIASASGVSVDLSGAVLRSRYASGALTVALGAEEALRQVLAGGEEHALVGCFAGESSLPPGGEEPWHVIGRVVEAGEDGPRVTVDGVVPNAPGWDHFAGHP